MPSIKSLLLLQVLLPLLRDAEPLCAVLTRAPLAGHILSIRILRFLRELQFPAELTRIFDTVPGIFCFTRETCSAVRRKILRPSAATLCQREKYRAATS